MAGKRALRAGLALTLALAASATGVEPSRPREIDPGSFHPVTVAPASRSPAIVYDTWPTPSLPGRPSHVPKPTPIVVVRPTPTPATVVRYPSVADARAYARGRIGSTQYACLDTLWEHESGWHTHSYNASSGAYGIPQALPGDKMAVIAADWRDNPVTQVKWGLRYIAGRYGTACQALTHWKDHNWY